MINIYFNKDVSQMFSNLLINVSSAYFFAAALTPAGISADFIQKIINFLLNLFAAIIYFALAVKINKYYE